MRALEPAGRAVEPAGRAVEPAGRALEPAERSPSKLGGPWSLLGGPEPVKRPRGQRKRQKKTKHSWYGGVPKVIVSYWAAA